MSGPEIKVSSPDKLLFPDDGVTKAEVVAHYELVGEAMLTFAAGRPLTLQRFPQGINGKGFMQKNAGAHFPDSIRRLPVPKRGGGETLYPVVDNASDFAYLANQNTVTFHMWTSTADAPGEPNWLIIDLDPEAGDLSGVRTATLETRKILQSFGLDGFPLATGSKGFHVWVPLTPGHTFERVSRASRCIAGLAAAQQPDQMTLEFLKKNRKGRVFVDWLRNGPTATSVVPFSLRPRPGAPVAVPLSWEEMPTAEPDGCRIGSVSDRLHLEQTVAAQELDVGVLEAAARAAGVDIDTPHDRFGR